MDLSLLKELYSIYSPSGEEYELINFVGDWVNENVPDAKVDVDSENNVYITRGECDSYPCVVAHTDQVQRLHSDDFEVIECKGILLGYSQKNRQQEGLGADDKNGVFIALECLRQTDVIKVALFSREEIGGVGSDNCDMAFFNDVRFVIQCDRRGNSDLITEISQRLCSEEFIQDIDYERFGYKPTYGLLSDVDNLVRNGIGVSCINLSCGYYKPHTDNEITIIEDLEKCFEFVLYMITNLTKTYEFTPWDDDWDVFMQGLDAGADEYEMAWNRYETIISDYPAATFEECYEVFGKYDYKHLKKETQRELFNQIKSIYFC